VDEPDGPMKQMRDEWSRKGGLSGETKIKEDDQPSWLGADLCRVGQRINSGALNSRLSE